MSITLDDIRTALAIIEKLAASDPANVPWQRDLAVAHDQIGDLWLDNKQPAPALEAFRKGLAIREKLAASTDPRDRAVLDLTWDYPTKGAIAEPEAEAVLAEINGFDGEGRPQRQHRYERLMLPWKTPSGEVFVTMCSRPVGASSNSKSAGCQTGPRSMKDEISA